MKPTNTNNNNSKTKKQKEALLSLISPVHKVDGAFELSMLLARRRLERVFGAEWSSPKLEPKEKDDVRKSMLGSDFHTMNVFFIHPDIRVPRPPILVGLVNKWGIPLNITRSATHTLWGKTLYWCLDGAHEEDPEYKEINFFFNYSTCRKVRKGLFEPLGLRSVATRACGDGLDVHLCMALSVYANDYLEWCYSMGYSKRELTSGFGGKPKPNPNLGAEGRSPWPQMRYTNDLLLRRKTLEVYPQCIYKGKLC
jgi:hypothetical protein